MTHFTSTIAAIFVVPAAFVAEPSLTYMLMIFKAGDAKAMQTLSDKAEVHAHEDPRWLALSGYAEAVLAGEEWLPWSKLEQFNKGKALIERAVRLSPKDTILRVIRFMIQAECPVFLGYRGNMAEDLNLILETEWSFEEASNRAFISEFGTFVLNSKGVDESSKRQWKQQKR